MSIVSVSLETKSRNERLAEKRGFPPRVGHKIKGSSVRLTCSVYGRGRPKRDRFRAIYSY